MEGRLSLYVAALVLATAISGAIAAYALLTSDRRYDSSSTALAVLMGVTAWWSIAAALMHATDDTATTLILYAITHVSTFVLPVSWLLFTLQYVGLERFVTRRTIASLAVVPSIAFAGLLTNPYHEWFIEDVWVDGGGAYVHRVPGLLYEVHLAYAYTLILVGVALLLHFAYVSRHLYRGQAAAIAVAGVIPLVANVAFIVRLSADGINLTPTSFAVSGVAFAYAVFRYKFLDVVPVARESVVERMRDGVVVLDTDDRVVDVNAAAEELLETSSGRLVGTVAGRVRLGDRSLASAVDDDRAEVTIDGPDGRRYVSVRPTPLTEESDGRLIILQDVTDGRSAEKRYRRLIENASDVVTVLEPDGTIRFQSPSSERVLGYDPEEMIGRYAIEFVHPEDRAAIAELFSHDPDDIGVAVRAEYRMRHADGSWRIVESAGRNLLDDPEIEGIVVNSRDVTERRRRERELERANEHLDEFASVVSHDLRNPLNVADGYLELIDDEVDHDALEVVHSQHRRMREIIEDALTLARSRASVEETEAVDLSTTARVAWANVDTKSAELSVVEDELVDADRTRLVRVFENLFRNAVEHGGEDVHVRVGTTDDGFYVADDGPGIEPGVADRIFDSGYSSAEGGAGLGLSIVSQIASAHGWRIAAVDADEGARFEIAVDGAADRIENGEV